MKTTTCAKEPTEEAEELLFLRTGFNREVILKFLTDKIQLLTIQT